MLDLASVSPDTGLLFSSDKWFDQKTMAQSTEVVEYADCISVEE